jgi:biopolymer transport protein ExbD
MKLRSPIPPRKTRLEIIPLIDVMFFLLASCMMVRLTMTKQQTVPVSLPGATTAGSEFKPDMINLAVDAAGDIYLGKERLPLPDIERRLADQFRKDPKTPVYVSADNATRHGDTIRAIDVARRAGFTKVAFHVKSAASP